MKKIFILWIGFAFLASGCYEVEHRVVLNSDFSGSLTFQERVPVRFNEAFLQSLKDKLGASPSSSWVEAGEKMFIMQYIEKKLTKAVGVDAWSKLAYVLNNQANQLNGVLYFKNLNKLKLVDIEGLDIAGNLDYQKIHFEKLSDGRVKFFYRNYSLKEKKDRLRRWSSLSEKETQELLRKNRTLTEDNFVASFERLQFPHLKATLDITFVLPGKVIEVQGFEKIGDYEVRFLLDEKKEFSNMVKIINNEDYFRKLIFMDESLYENSDIFKPFDEYQEFFVIIEAPSKDYFNYQKEVSTKVGFKDIYLDKINKNIQFVANFQKEKKEYAARGVADPRTLEFSADFLKQNNKNAIAELSEREMQMLQWSILDSTYKYFLNNLEPLEISSAQMEELSMMQESMVFESQEIMNEPVDPSVLSQAGSFEEVFEEANEFLKDFAVEEGDIPMEESLEEPMPMEESAEESMPMEEYEEPKDSMTGESENEMKQNNFPQRQKIRKEVLSSVRILIQTYYVSEKSSQAFQIKKIQSKKEGEMYFQEITLQGKIEKKQIKNIQCYYAEDNAAKILSQGVASINGFTTIYLTVEGELPKTGYIVVETV